MQSINLEKEKKVIDELDKKTLTRLYAKEKLTLRTIAMMYDRSYFYAHYRSQKYGIKLRPRGNERKITINKSILQSLYVNEGKSSNEVAAILSCSYTTVLKRCKEYGIPIRSKKIKKITKERLENMYIREGKTIREIAKILECSFETVRLKCKNFGIALRSPGNEKVEIDKLTLKRLFVHEGKSKEDIARIYGCSVSAIHQWVKRFGLREAPQQFLFEKIYSERKQAQNEAVR